MNESQVFERELTVASGVLAGHDAPDLTASILERLRQPIRPQPELRPASARRFWAAAILLSGSLAVLGVATVGWLRSKPAPVRVLWIESAPRWDYRLRKNILLRDPDVVVQAFLTSLEPGFEQEHSAGVAALTRVPGLHADAARASADLANYDVVLLGDLQPKDLGDGAATRFAIALVDFVRAGGGVAMLAGERGMPQAWSQTPLRELLPVRLPRAEASAMPERMGGLVPRPSSTSQPHPLVRLGEDAEATVASWSKLTIHDGIITAGLMPNAQAVLIGKREDGVDMPLLVTMPVGAGRVVLSATHELWRLRAVVPGAFTASSRNLVSWLRPRSK